jgi:signal transduction histidine kinase
MAQEQRSIGEYTPTINMPLSRILVSALCLTVLWSVAQTLPRPVWPRGAGAMLAATAYVVIFLLVAALPSLGPRVRFGLILGAGALSVATQLLDPHASATVAAIAATALAGSRLALLPGGIVATLIGCGMIAATYATTHQTSAGLALSQAASYFFTFLAMASFSRLRREQQRTAELLQEVLAGRDAQVHAAKLDERARLAREMHDVLAHTLSALSIQLEGTRMLAEQRGGDPALLQALERISRLSREGLLEARRAVGSLRGDSLPGPDLLPSLVDAFERDTGILSTLQIDGDGRDLSPEARVAIYRTAQEALTNILKHAEATAVTVALRYTAEDVELRIDNDGRPRPSPVPGGGHGLTGMRERAELLGGRLEAGPTANGFSVRLWIPEPAERE